MNASSSGGQQIAQTLENALKGERSFEHVDYAVTGMPDADLLSGIQVLVDKYPEYPALDSRSRNLQRIFEFLAARYKDRAEAQHDQAARAFAQWQTGLGQLQPYQQAQPLPSTAPYAISSATLGTSQLRNIYPHGTDLANDCKSPRP